MEINLYEQIYKRNKQLSNIPDMRKLNAITEHDDIGLSRKMKLLVFHIMYLLQNNSHRLDFKEIQLVTLNRLDSAVEDCIGKKKQEYYMIINHLIEKEFLYKVKPNVFLVSPYMISIMSPSHKIEWMNYLHLVQAARSTAIMNSCPPPPPGPPPPPTNNNNNI